MTQQAGTEQTGQQQAATQQQTPPPNTEQGKQPPWADSEFDAERAWKKIQALEADKDKLSKRPVLDADAKRKLSEYDQLIEAQKTEAQKAQDELVKWQTEAQTWRSNAVGATVKALAATDFADPDDAVRNLDASKYLDVDGTIDEKAIKADLDKLLDAKPHYRRQEGQQGPRVPRPNTAQGADGRAAVDPAQQFAAILSGRMQ